ncbi:MAG TPA: hypothetical protein VH353_03895 [Caulobacteraceae bacterium]|nr:hypothetical protein [Caulobacteraceae bacterium]
MSGIAPGDLAAAHERLLRDRSVQWTFSEAPAPPHLPAWLISLGRLIAELVKAALPVLRVLFWVGLGLALALVLYLILSEVVGVRLFGRRRAQRPTLIDWRPDRTLALALLEDADRLASTGRFDEAVRLLLHRGVQDIEARRPRLVRPALTARDIGALPGLPAAAQTAFAEMARIVEASAFAGRAAGPDGFARCREAYETFAFPEAWA